MKEGSHMKTVQTGGIPYLDALTGSPDWYWGMDHTGGDLYEAEELYTDGHRIDRTRLILVRRSDGAVFEPIPAEKGRYFGKPVFDDSRIALLTADFPAGELRLWTVDPDSMSVASLASVPRDSFEDCYNLMPSPSPLMLTRQTGEVFEILWPRRVTIPIHPHESFCFRDGDLLFFSRWYEDPDYREETVTRSVEDGRIVSSDRASACLMPDGQKWVLK